MGKVNNCQILKFVSSAQPELSICVDNMSCHRQYLCCSANNCLTLPALQSLIIIKK